MRLLLLADLHLGSRLLEWGPLARARRADLLVAWGEAMDLALSPDERVDAVLVAGDLFDEEVPDADLRHRVLSDVERLTAAGRMIVLLPGAYDGGMNPGNVYRRTSWPAGVTLVGSEPGVRPIAVGEDTLHLHTGGPDAGVVVPEARDAGRHVGLFHAALSPAEGWMPPDLPLWTPDALATSGLDLAVLGGGHVFRDVQAGTTRIVVPGTTVGLRPGEWNERWFVLADLDGDGVRLSCRSRSVRPLLDIHVRPRDEGLHSEPQLIAWLRARVNGAAWAVITLEGPAEEPWDAGALQDALRGGDTVVEIVDLTTGLTEGLGKKTEREDSVLGLFVQGMRHRHEEAAGESERRQIQSALALGWRELVRGDADAD